MNCDFQRKVEFLQKRYPNADEKHLYILLGVLINKKTIREVKQ